MRRNGLTAFALVFPGAGPVPRAAPRVLGQPGHPHLVLRRHRAHAGPRRLGSTCGRCSASSSCWASPTTMPSSWARTRHQEEHGDGLHGVVEGTYEISEVGRVRGPDNGGRVQPAAVRARCDGQGVPGHSAARHTVSAVLATRVALHPAGPSVARRERVRPGPWRPFQWFDETAPVPEVVEVDFALSTIECAGSDIDVQFAGPDLDALRAAAGEVRQQLRAYAGA